VVKLYCEGYDRLFLQNTCKHTKDCIIVARSTKCSTFDVAE